MKKEKLIKRISSLVGMFILLFAVALFTVSCTDDDEPAPTQNIWEIVSANSNLSGIKGELEAAGLDGALRGTGPMTFFAPSNTALSSLLNTLGLEDFSPVSDAITQAVLTYHVANQELFADALGASITTLQGESISVQGSDLVTGATSPSKVIEADIKATNGVIHIVDVVMVPPSLGALIVQTLGTVAQPILLGGDFTILAGGLQLAEQYAGTSAQIPSLLGTLTSTANNAQFTVFAPVDQVLQQAGVSPTTFSGEQWYGIIANHVLVGRVAAAQLVGTETGTIIPTVLSSGLDNYPGIRYLGMVPVGGTGDPAPALDSDLDGTPDAWVVVPDAVSASNGVVHAIAGVLLPPSAPADPMVGSFSVVGQGVRGTNSSEVDWTASITISNVSGSTYRTTDITFGGYTAMYTDADANPGDMTVSGNSITISGVEDTVYGDDQFDGTGTINENGTISISVSNGFGDSFDVVLTKSSARVADGNVISGTYRVAKVTKK